MGFRPVRCRMDINEPRKNRPSHTSHTNKTSKKIVVDTVLLNLVDFKAYEHVGLRGRNMSSSREGV